MEWSEEVIAFLAVTDYQERIPLLEASALSKDIIEKDVMFKVILSDLMEEIRRKTDNWAKKEAQKTKARLKRSLNGIKRDFYRKCGKGPQDMAYEHPFHAMRTVFIGVGVVFNSLSF